MFTKDDKFRDVYFLAAEDDKTVPQRAVEGTKGWIECFDKAVFKGCVFCGDVTDVGEDLKRLNKRSGKIMFRKMRRFKQQISDAECRDAMLCAGWRVKDPPQVKGSSFCAVCGVAPHITA